MAPDEVEWQLAEVGGEAQEMVAGKGYHLSQTMTGVRAAELHKRGRAQGGSITVTHDSRPVSAGGVIRGSICCVVWREGGARFAHLLVTGGCVEFIFTGRRRYENGCLFRPSPSTSAF